MAKIQILDEHIANQIAAGEVVERPSSVVKELVENAIDAGSTKVDVMVEEGGLMSIRVTDNGSGIEPEDCETAFYRHATSKLSSGRDLFQIRSLGFRGEALPSIAAVAKVQLISASSDSGLGYKVSIEGGKLKESEAAPAPKGTDLVIRELFYNTPARLKYMKTIQTELGHISDVMYRQALAHPEIGFSLRHNGNALLQTPGNGDLLQVIAAIYGNNAARAMVPIEYEDPDYTLRGFIGRPDLTRSNRNAISTVVNGRYIRNTGLQQAILRGYHTLLPIGRYPLVVLQLTMHPSLVDVNVHPAKLEVRFSKEGELNTFVETAVKGALSQHVLIPQVVKQQIGKGDSRSVIQEQFSFPSPSQAPVDTANRQEFIHSGNSAPVSGSPSREGSTAGGQGQGMDVPSVSSSMSQVRSPQVREGAAAGYAAGAGAGGSYNQKGWQNEVRTSALPKPEHIERLYESPAEAPQVPQFPELTLIGQHHGTYLIANNDTGLYLIDQHAAHERVNYEYYYEKFGSPADASQELLLPITLEFTPSDSEKLKDRLHWFESAGVILEHFGGQTFRVVSHPYWFPKGEEAAIIEEMADWVLNERSIDLAKIREKSSILCSCKASIKANQKLTQEEAVTLLRRLAACRQPYTCPHGRPIVVSFSTYDLEKLFKRVM
ncbi:DNA mismatch repair endonuclease MutL [Paenibacillus sp. CAA11]|uniref:DNA mismatch repair endonuclease MutL n=1 Tax=Paenibacillus sp. CAA11 TaxID=1532905 RepID=UPI000D3D7D88|nr:DNA mismatch repair endonuclease MutL [Paenibacillus sp. CAA11]AWB44892.1 DNA mismatch repair endonuclease MutL [Paenibacillus sp. CAA11]